MQPFIARLSSALVLVLLLNGAGIAAASERQLPRYEIGPYGGVIDFDTVRGLNGNIYGGRFGVNVTPQLGIEANIGASKASSPRPNIDPETIWMSTVDLVYTPFTSKIIAPFLSGGLGRLTSVVAVPGNEAKGGLSFDLGGGLKMWANDRFAVRADFHSYWAGVEDGVTTDSGYYRDMMGTVGVGVGLGSVEPAPLDADLDGVPDELDRCAGSPSGVTVDVFGCPPDADRDGIPDYEDGCASTPAKAKVDGKGCPTDTDADGIFDGIDICSRTPKAAQVDAKGCPIDSDGDGVFDGIDRCAGTQRGVMVTADGCPQPMPTAKPAKPMEKWLVLRNVTFATGRAELSHAALPALDEVAAMLAANPDVKVEIRGYSDSVGSEASNLNLTQRRAEAVRQYLIMHGVDAARMRARGYGEADAVGSNETSEGRAMNRRVEMHRINQ